MAKTRACTRSDVYKNNIFNWATSELSQDAVIACILNANKKFSCDFIKKMISLDIEGKSKSKSDIDIQNIEVYRHGRDYLGKSIDASEKGIKNIDVFAKVTSKEGKKIAIIIEDKTNSFLHDSQEHKYINSIINGEYKEIHFVLLKTGDYYFFERDEYKKSINDYKDKKRIYFHTMLLDEYEKEIGRINDDSFKWIGDYKNYISDKKTKLQKNILTDLNFTTTRFIKEKIGLEIDDDKIAIKQPEGAGKRNYDIIIFDSHGSKANGKNNVGNDKELFCIPMYINLDDSKHAKLGLYIHKYDGINGDGISGHTPRKYVNSKFYSKIHDYIEKEEIENLKLSKKGTKQNLCHFLYDGSKILKNEDDDDLKAKAKEIYNLSRKIKKFIEK